MKYNKFIVYDNKIIIGKVRFHKELLPDDFKYELISGGGEFEIDKEKKIFFIVEDSKSFDFGKYPDSILTLVFEDERFSEFEKYYL